MIFIKCISYCLCLRVALRMSDYLQALGSKTEVKSGAEYIN
jgi:hypothetical protein